MSEVHDNNLRIFVSKGILSKSSEDAASAERVGKEEGKRAGDILHDRLTSRRERGREGSIGAEGPNGAANSHRKKERWERATDSIC